MNPVSLAWFVGNRKLRRARFWDSALFRERGYTSTEIRTCRKCLNARRLSEATCSPVDTHPDSRPRQSPRAREKSTASTIEEIRMTPTQTELSCFALFAIFTLWCKMRSANESETRLQCKPSDVARRSGRSLSRISRTTRAIADRIRFSARGRLAGFEGNIASLGVPQI